MRWDIFCRVVDNFGDIGVCWRLARQLAREYGADVCLWVDHLPAFQTLCPAVSTDVADQYVESIRIRHWTPEIPSVEIPDVVIEAFACELPDSYLSSMASRSRVPVWINLEYLSAEAWVDDCHLLTSPHPRYPLIKTFFFPGFTPRTGGLLREQSLLEQRAKLAAKFSNGLDTSHIDSTGFWRGLGLPEATSGGIRVSLFCYENQNLSRLLQIWSEGPSPIELLVMPGPGARQVADWFGGNLSPGDCVASGRLTARTLSFLSQENFDRLLWRCDVNFVRGEDSFVRAQWAARPFIWQIYPQAEQIHVQKLNAFLDRYLDVSGLQGTIETGFDAAEPESSKAAAGATRRLFEAWNGCGDIDSAWREFAMARLWIEAHNQHWARHLHQMADLAKNLARFVGEI